MRGTLKIVSITSILVMTIVVALLFNVKIPLCYNTFEDTFIIKEDFVLYDTKIVNKINEDIRQASLYYMNIIGNSMFPSIRNGDTCVCAAQNDYYKGDIVSFYVPVEDKVELIAHRIITKNNGAFTTKGDNNNIGDGWVITKDQIFCKVPEKNLFDKFKFAVQSGGRFNILSLIG